MEISQSHHESESFFNRAILHAAATVICPKRGGRSVPFKTFVSGINANCLYDVTKGYVPKKFYGLKMATTSDLRSPSFGLLLTSIYLTLCL